MEKFVKLMIEAKDVFIRSPIKTSTFHSVLFQNVAKLVLTDLWMLYTRHLLVKHILFQLFRTLNLQATQNPWRFAKEQILIYMHLFDYDQQEKWKRWGERAADRQMRRTNSVRKSMVPPNEGMNTVCDVISGTEERRRLCLKRSKDGSELLGNKWVIEVEKRLTGMHYSLCHPKRGKKLAPVL